MGSFIDSSQKGVNILEVAVTCCLQISHRHDIRG